MEIVPLALLNLVIYPMLLTLLISKNLNYQMASLFKSLLETDLRISLNLLKKEPVLEKPYGGIIGEN